ncbi:MAG: hypothetical protein CMO55_13195 [Verrucomicrobiales bacterium]|nr:hypothetical protein [Verrucomicrobiales bacterium]
MIDFLFGATLLAYVVFLVAMRWAHRNWGQAILATVFAPLVIIPLGAICVLAVTFILRGVNWILHPFETALSPETMGWVGVIVAVTIITILTIHYVRDQRDLSLVKTGPRLGPRYRAPKPNINYRGPLR